MDDSEAVEIEPERQRPEPVEVRSQFVGRELPHRLGMLVAVLLVVGPEVPARFVWIWGVEGKGVEFMIAHHCESRPGVDHRADKLKGFPDLGASVNEVAQKDSLPLGVLVDALVLGIAECREEVYKLAGMPVDVSDEVVHGRRLRPPDEGGQEIYIRGLGTKVVPELVFNTWAGMCRCGSLFLDLDSLKR